MTYAGTMAAGVALVGALSGAPSAVAGQATEGFVEIGRTIARGFDSSHGTPVVSRTGYDCSHLRLCPNATNPTPTDVEASSAIARGFAAALDVPLVPPDSPQTRCSGWPGEVDGMIGLWTRFGLVSATSDSVEVMVTTGCRSHGPVRTASYAQAQLYTLRRSVSGGWEVLRIEMVWIT